MSVVNQMLRDLEQRKVDEANYSAEYKPSNTTQRNRSILIVIVVFFLTVIGIAIYWSINNRFVEITNTQIEQDKTLSEAPIIEQLQKEEEQKQNPVVTHPVVKEIEQPAIALVIEPEIVAVESEKPAFEKSASSPSNLNDVTRSLKDKIRDALQLGDNETAIKLLNQLVINEPDNVDAKKKLAALLFSSGKSVEAKVILEQAIQNHSGDPSLRLMLARLLVNQNDQSTALRVITEKTQSLSLSPDFMAYRASLAEQLGQHQLAFADYDELTRKQPMEAKWWLGVAISAERLSLFEQASDAYRQVLALNQLNDDIHQFVRKRLSFLVIN